MSPEIQTIEVGVLADPGLPYEIASELVHELPRTLAENASVDAKVSARRHRLVADESGDIQLSDVVENVKAHDFDYIVCITDQPERLRRQPVGARTIADSNTVVVSVPTFGTVRIKSRTKHAINQLIQQMINEEEVPVSVANSKLKPVTDEASSEVRYVNTSRMGATRLLAGMVFANRPWRLLPSLSSALIAAIGTLGYLLITSTIWITSDVMGPLRLGLIGFVAIVAMVGWLILDHHMWERSDKAESGAGLAHLYNASTVISLTIGVVIFYAMLFLVGLVASRVLIDAEVITSQVGGTTTLADRVSLVWLACSVATVAGALGTGLESDEAVNQAAYGQRHRARKRELSDGRKSSTDD